MTSFSRALPLCVIMMTTTAAHAQHDQHGGHNQHDQHGGHDQHEAHDHSDMASSPQDNAAPTGAVPMSTTPELEAALAAGGTPVVAEVLGVVCDFCATAMNKIFGSREEVAAVYVDLDTKALNLVLKKGHNLDDQTIEELAVQAGYRIAAVYRDPVLQGG